MLDLVSKLATKLYVILFRVTIAINCCEELVQLSNIFILAGLKLNLLPYQGRHIRMSDLNVKLLCITKKYDII